MRGRIIVIESGTDGSGKATQTELLFKSLQEKGYRVKKVEYPNYASDSSALVKMYLRGDFGKNAGDVDPYVASTFYAIDRYASFKREWEYFYNSGGIIIADRYTTSNMVHQASKMDDDAEKEKFLTWIEDYEYGLYKLPRPNFVYFLDVPVKVSKKLMEGRKNKITNEDEKDIHESDLVYLEKTYKNSKYVAEKYDWEIVSCIDEDEDMRKIEDIHEEILSRVLNYLE